MKMKSLALSIFLGILFVPFTSFSQEKINVNREIDIVKVYEQTIKEGYATLDIYEKLANTQYLRSNYKEAKKWFEKWFEVELPNDETAINRYKQTLKALKVSTEENKYLQVLKASSH